MKLFGIKNWWTAAQASVFCGFFRLPNNDDMVSSISFISSSSVLILASCKSNQIKWIFWINIKFGLRKQFFTFSEIAFWSWANFPVTSSNSMAVFLFFSLSDFTIPSISSISAFRLKFVWKMRFWWMSIDFWLEEKETCPLTFHLIVENFEPIRTTSSILLSVAYFDHSCTWPKLKITIYNGRFRKCATNIKNLPHSKQPHIFPSIFGFGDWASTIRWCITRLNPNTEHQTANCTQCQKQFEMIFF